MLLPRSRHALKNHIKYILSKRADNVYSNSRSFLKCRIVDCRQPQAFLSPLIHLLGTFSCPVRSTTRSGTNRGRRAGSDQCHLGLLFKSRPCRHRQSMMVRTSFLRPGRASNLNENCEGTVFYDIMISYGWNAYIMWKSG